MKSANWISAIGRRPFTAAPIETPTIIDSVSGVSMTRSSPNSAYSPSVARKTPPFLPTSSPSTITRSSRRISSASAVADRLDERLHRHRPVAPRRRRRGRAAPCHGDGSAGRLGASSVARSSSTAPAPRRIVLRLARVQHAGSSSGRLRKRGSASRSFCGLQLLGACGTCVCWSSDECAVRRITLASISVGPSPRRARSTASRAAAVAARDVAAVDDHAGDAVARGPIGDVRVRHLLRHGTLIA